jgi:hypothetical protein
MEEIDLTPEKCRERAQWLRDQAAREANPQTRKQYEEIAVTWQQLSGEIEKQAKREQP